MQNYRKLIVWQVADELAFKVYQLTRSFPQSELYGLTSQLRRAALSVPTNIAEGVGRQGRNETRQFANVALGSLAEAEYLLDFSCRLEHLSVSDKDACMKLIARLGSLLWRFYKSF